jgi:glycerol uptake facilitator protein
MHAILPIHGKGRSRWFYAWVPVCAPIAGGFMGGSFFMLYYEGRASILLFISIAVAVAVLAFGLWANKHMYRSKSAEIIPAFEDTRATAASAAATYTPTGEIPVIKRSFFE